MSAYIIDEDLYPGDVVVTSETNYFVIAINESFVTTYDSVRCIFDKMHLVHFDDKACDQTGDFRSKKESVLLKLITSNA